MSRNSYDRRNRVFAAVVTALVVTAVVLALAIVVQTRLDALERQTAGTVEVVATATPETRVVFQTQAVVTQEPTEAPTATPEPIISLPVFTRGLTKEKAIAITLDDCTNLTVLRRAVDFAHEMGAKITLFPMGSAIIEADMSDILRTCVLEYGFEVENRTWNDSTLYSESNTTLAKDIWGTDVALDYVLNKEYGMHLLRPAAGQGTEDPRTNEYLNKIGYSGFVTWTVNSADVTTEQLQDSIAPGNIYIFNCTANDVQRMVQFMNFAASNGYEMWNLSPVLGYPEVTYADPSGDVLSKPMPTVDEYEIVPVSFSNGDRAWQVLLIQSRLIKLGYLYGTADGVYGDATARAVMEFQAVCGMPCTGIASPELQQRLFAESAPTASASPVPTPIVVPVTAAPTEQPAQ